MKSVLTILAKLCVLMGICLSTHVISGGKEIAMSKCSKENNLDDYSDDMEDTNRSSGRKRYSEHDSDYRTDSDDADCDRYGGCSEPDASLELQIPQKTPEQIVQGEK